MLQVTVALTFEVVTIKINKGHLLVMYKLSVKFVNIDQSIH